MAGITGTSSSPTWVRERLRWRTPVASPRPRPRTAAARSCLRKIRSLLWPDRRVEAAPSGGSFRGKPNEENDGWRIISVVRSAVCDNDCAVLRPGQPLPSSSFTCSLDRKRRRADRDQPRRDLEQHHRSLRNRPGEPLLRESQTQIEERLCRICIYTFPQTA